MTEAPKNLDKWTKEYNEQRPHSGKYCFEKKPMQTFLDSIPLAKDKMLNQNVQTVQKVAYVISSTGYYTLLILPPVAGPVR